jgi:hypothetical protein
MSRECKGNSTILPDGRSNPAYKFKRSLFELKQRLTAIANAATRSSRGKSPFDEFMTGPKETKNV